MRISSINVAQPRKLNYNLKRRTLAQEQTQPQQVQQPSFKGLKAGAGALFGGILGATLTVISGGTLAPVLLAGMAGTTGGAFLGKSAEKDEPDSDYDYDGSDEEYD